MMEEFFWLGGKEGCLKFAALLLSAAVILSVVFSRVLRETDCRTFRDIP